MTRSLPFLQNIPSPSPRKNFCFSSFNHKNNRILVVQFGLTIFVNANVLIVPTFTQLTDSSINQSRQIVQNMNGMLPLKNNLRTECEIVTHKDRRTNGHTCGQRLVHTITQTNQVTVILGFNAVSNLKDSKQPFALIRHSKGFTDDLHLRCSQ